MESVKVSISMLENNKSKNGSSRFWWSSKRYKNKLDVLVGEEKVQKPREDQRPIDLGADESGRGGNENSS